MARQLRRLAVATLLALPLAVSATELNLPSYRYGDAIQVECMNRSSETGEHIQLANNEIQWIPFPVCNETSKPLEFNYGIEGEVNCTIPLVTDPFFHLLEFYLHADAPLMCRVANRPSPHIETVGERPYTPEYVPLVFALAGTLQMSHLHIASHLNVLLHSTPKHHIHPHDSGVIDSGVAYSTSPLGHNIVDNDSGKLKSTGGRTAAAAENSRRLIIGDPLPLSFSVRWFPTPHLPKTEGRVEWSGMGSHIGPSTIFYSLVSFLAGLIVSAVYFFGTVLPKRLRGRTLGGATPLGYGIGTGGGGVGNGWGIAPKRAMD